jgi:hypothetical protein
VPDEFRPDEISGVIAAAVAVHRHQISGDATDHAFDLQQSPL